MIGFAQAQARDGTVFEIAPLAATRRRRASKPGRDRCW
jgi:hypothetical protein